MESLSPRLECPAGGDAWRDIVATLELSTFKKSMAKKIKEKKEPKKLNSYTEEKNNQPPVRVEETVIVGEETILPETKSIIITKEFDRPLISVEEAIEAWKQYQDLINALMKEGDVYVIRGKKKATKQGYQKIARFFGYSSEVIREKKEIEISAKDIWKRLEGRNVLVIKKGEPIIIHKAWMKVIAPTGRFATRGSACSSDERPFNKPYNDLPATAQTRAFKAAVDVLSGMGDLELAEDGDNTVSDTETPQNGNQSDNNNNFMGTGDPDTWKPIFKVNSYSKLVPSNDKMPISEKAVEWIKTSLKRAGVKLDDNTKVLFILNNRADGIPRTKEINQLNKGDFYDISETIKKKGKEGLLKLIEVEKLEIPIVGEPPQEISPS